MPKPDSKWVSMALKDIEKYCYNNDLSVIAHYLETAQRELDIFQNSENTSNTNDIGNFGGLRLVWSQPKLEN